MSELRSLLAELVQDAPPTEEKLQRTLDRARRRHRRRRITAGVVALVVAAAGLTGAALSFRHSARPMTTPLELADNGVIAFVHMAPGSLTGDLYVANPDGTGLRRVTRSGIVTVDVAVSPDGSRVAFAGTTDAEGRAPWNIFVVNIDGTGLRQLTHDAAPVGGGRSPVNEFPSWTADGRIRYYRNTATNHVPGPGQGLWEMNGDGSGAHLVIPDWIPFEGTWNPQGTRVAWVADAGLAVADPSGGNRILVGRGHHINAPAWSPDGAQIAFATGADLQVVNADGSGLHTVFRCGSSCGVDFPTWSPDGTEIAFSVGGFGDGRIEIVSADGTHRRVVPLPISACCPVWQPISDSRTVLTPPTPSPSSCAPPLGPPGNVGCAWSPDVDPIGQGSETTLEDAAARAGYPLYLPEVPLASDGSVSRVWVGTEQGGDGMLPNHDQTEVAVSYSSGVVVTWVPWVYGAKAPPFSQAQNAAHYREVVSQAPASAAAVERIEGIPALVIAQDWLGQGNPGSLEFQLGTANANAVTVAVLGRLATADLESVAASIIAQWQQSSA